MSATEYELNYIQRALSAEMIEPPDKARCNGNESVLVSLFQAHQRGGLQGAKIAWGAIEHLMPGLKQVMHSKIPAGMKPLGGGNGWFIIHAHDLHKLPKITWLIDGMIPSKGLTVMYGPSGAFKSFYATDLALRIAQERPVAYMAGEGEYGYRQRVAAWCKHNQAGTGQLYMCLGAVPVLENIEVSTFIETLKPIKPALVVIDTLARSMVGADENNARDMGLFIKACTAIQDELDCATLLIHHTNKGGVQERGSGALRGASDSMIKMEGMDGYVTVESAKSKDAKPFQTLSLQFIPVEVTLEFDGIPETVESGVLVPAERVIQNSTDSLTQQQRKVLDTIALEVFEDSGADAGELCELTGIGRGHLYRILSKLLKLEFVEQDGKRSPYQITEKGREALTR